MTPRVHKQVFPVLAAVLMFTASTASAQHKHGDGEHKHKAAPEMESTDMAEHHMMDGMPHFMTTGEHADAVKQALTGYAAAAQSSVDGMAAYVVPSDGFTIVEGSHPNWGWTDYRDNHLKPEFESSDFTLKFYTYDEFFVSATPMLAYATFKISLEATIKGEDISRDRKGAAILVNTADGWRIRHLHTS